MTKYLLQRQNALILCVASTLAIFIFDCYTPLGIADGVLYSVPVLLTLWLPPGRSTLTMVVCVTPLVILGGYLSPYGEVAIGMAIVNRILSLLVVWGIALLVLYRKGADIKLQRSTATLADLRAQRATLVREVHHRIKNNLQGVIGLLWQQRIAHPELRTVMEQTIAQLHTVAMVFGLQSERASADVVLGDMLQAIIRSSNEASPERMPLRLELAAVKPVHVAKEEAVPIGLIMNELIMNAVKHGAADAGAAPAVVQLQGDCESARISIRNAGVLPADFSLAERRGIGDGLQLVLALLPSGGGTLTIDHDGGDIIAQLSLAPPVIRSDLVNDAP